MGYLYIEHPVSTDDYGSKNHVDICIECTCMFIIW
jgi:hypothetical protein